MRSDLLGLLVASTCVGLVQCNRDNSADGGESSGGTGPRGGSAGAPQGGAGPVCKSPSGQIATVPFTLSISEEAGEGGASGAGTGEGGGAGRAQGCTYVGEGPYPASGTTCAGNVRRTETGFVFEDGSTLTWTGAADGLPLPETPAGAIPWVEYEERYYSFCFVCGGYTSKAISILATEGGQALYVGSTNGPAPVDPTLLFDAAIEFETKCDTAPYNFDCYTVVDHLFDVVIGTDPVQRIPYSELTRIDVPGGTFDVFWSNADASGTYNSGCFDGRSPIDTNEFAALRVSE